MRRLSAVVGLVFLFGCQAPPADLTDAEGAPMEAEVAEALENHWASFQTALLDGDSEVFYSHWTNDMRLVEPGMNFVREEYVAFAEEFWGSGGAVTAFEIDPLETFVHGDVAYQMGQYRETVQFPGGEPESFFNNFFARWEKQSDGGWKIDRFLAGPVDAPEAG